MRIALSGSNGLVGRRLRAELPEVEWLPLVRDRSRDGVYWNPVGDEIDAAALEGLDAVVHLAGEPIVGRWTATKRRRIRDSRVLGTGLLARTLAGLTTPPRVLLSASAIGVYGDTADRAVGEENSPGEGFLAGVCSEWEAATEPAAAAGIRVCRLRIGMVLSREGGALKKMLPAFKLGLGGRLGSGRQFMSWISIDDLVGAIRFLLQRDDLEGPFNLTAPTPVSNAEFTRTLGRVVRRPTVLPVPGFALRLLFGELADSLLLGGQRVEPRRLMKAGYAFRHPELEAALRAVLGPPERT